MIKLKNEQNLFEKATHMKNGKEKNNQEKETFKSDEAMKNM